MEALPVEALPALPNSPHWQSSIGPRQGRAGTGPKKRRPAPFAGSHAPGVICRGSQVARFYIMTPGCTLVTERRRIFGRKLGLTAGGPSWKAGVAVWTAGAVSAAFRQHKGYHAGQPCLCGHQYLFRRAQRDPVMKDVVAGALHAFQHFVVQPAQHRRASSGA